MPWQAGTDELVLSRPHCRSKKPENPIASWKRYIVVERKIVNASFN